MVRARRVKTLTLTVREEVKLLTLQYTDPNTHCLLITKHVRMIY